MLNWRPIEERYGGGESCFGLNFREEYLEIANLLSDDNGRYVNGQTATVNGFQYKAKIVPKKDGSGDLIFVEKRKATATNEPQAPALPVSAPAEVHKDPVRMTTLEFDTHCQNIAKQFIAYLNQLAPHTSMSVGFTENESKT